MLCFLLHSAEEMGVQILRQWWCTTTMQQMSCVPACAQSGY